MTAYCFDDDKLNRALAEYAMRTDADVVSIALFLREAPEAAKLRVQPSPSTGGLSPEGKYPERGERID